MSDARESYQECVDACYEAQRTAKTLAAYAMNLASGKRVALFEIEHILTLARNVGAIADEAENTRRRIAMEEAGDIYFLIRKERNEAQQQVEALRLRLRPWWKRIFG